MIYLGLSIIAFGLWMVLICLSDDYEPTRRSPSIKAAGHESGTHTQGATDGE